MRFIFRSFLLLLPILGTAQSGPQEKELLWEITHPNSQLKSYLFGTLHANDRALFALSDSVYIAFDKASKVILETDIYQLFTEFDTRNKLPQTRFDDQGKSYTNSEESSKTLYGSEDGMPQFLDAYFQVLAAQFGKPVRALETIIDQYTLAINFKLYERDVFNNQINSFTQDKMLELYLRGDLEALNRFMKSYLSVQEGLYEQIIVNRNLHIRDSLIEMLKLNESFFCAVGAGHLGGDGGLIQLLRYKGYKIRPVQWQISSVPVASKTKLQKSTEYIQIDTPTGLVAKFPGKPIRINQEDGSTRYLYRELGQGNTYEVTIYPMDSLSSQDQIARIYINPPPSGKITKKALDNGTQIYQGLSDTYPEGLNHVQLIFSDTYFAVVKCYGGNKFLHSNRPQSFFEKVWFD